MWNKFKKGGWSFLKGVVSFISPILKESAKLTLEMQIRDRMNKRWNNRIDFLVNLDMFIDRWFNIKIRRV